jgi:hypothetical protein
MKITETPRNDSMGCSMLAHTEAGFAFRITAKASLAFAAKVADAAFQRKFGIGTPNRFWATSRTRPITVFSRAADAICQLSLSQVKSATQFSQLVSERHFGAFRARWSPL